MGRAGGGREPRTCQHSKKEKSKIGTGKLDTYILVCRKAGSEITQISDTDPYSMTSVLHEPNPYADFRSDPYLYIDPKIVSKTKQN